MKIIKCIKRFLGIELPYLLEDQETEIIETTENTLNSTNQFYSREKELDILNKCNILAQCGFSMKEINEICNEFSRGLKEYMKGEKII